ncbi:MAG: hypothetical protein ACKO35_03360 [Planctomycetaceae bacterium]
MHAFIPDRHAARVRRRGECRGSALLAVLVLAAFHGRPVEAQPPVPPQAALQGPATGAVTPAPAATQPVDVVLEDQFRNRRGTADLRGDVVVLVYAARHGAEAALDVGRRLHLRFHPTADGAEAEAWSTQPVVPPAGWPAGVRVPDVHVVPIACVPEVPRPLHAVARTRLRQESPHVSVWLDFDDVMRQQFGMVPDEPNVAVIDTRGVVHGVRSGHVDPALFEDLVRVVDRLRVASLANLRTAAVPPPVVPAGSVAPRGAAAGSGVVPAGGIR